MKFILFRRKKNQIYAELVKTAFPQIHTSHTNSYNFTVYLCVCISHILSLSLSIYLSLSLSSSLSKVLQHQNHVRLPPNVVILATSVHVVAHADELKVNQNANFTEHYFVPAKQAHFFREADTGAQLLIITLKI